MLSLKDIKGQNNAVRYLSNNLKDGKIANSYLFCGPEGVGRALAAKAFIAALICGKKDPEGIPCLECPSCKRVESDDHPDVTWIKPEKNRAIKIETIRKVKDTLSLKPFEAGVSVCVIEDAHLMTVEASNALLKVLEEPPGRSMLILISSKKERLLDTVVSRCVEVRFSSLPLDETGRMIVDLCGEMTSEEADFYAALSQGSPGSAIRLFEEGLIDRKDRILDMLKAIATESDPCCLNWDTDSKDEIIEDIELLIMLLRDIAIHKEGIDDLIVDRPSTAEEAAEILKDYSVDRISAIIGKVIGVKSMLLGHVNPRIIAQNLPGMLKA